MDEHRRGAEQHRISNPVAQAVHDAMPTSVRPLCLKEFIGQEGLRENLLVFVNAAKKRAEAMDHVLMYGPPGLGKTTLAQIIANELGVEFRATSGPVITKAADLAAILTNLQPRDVLFIDEIHRLNPHVEEILYPAMEDFRLDIVIGEGPAARTVQIDLPPFTLVAATTRAGLVTGPLRDRFGIPLTLAFYSEYELTEIVLRAAGIMEMPITEDGAGEIARRSRGTPRIAGRLLRRVRDFAMVDNHTEISADVADAALQQLDVDTMGLDRLDRQYLHCLANHYGGGPAGVETLATAMANERDILEEVIEPYLIQSGFVQRTARGRILTQNAWSYLGLPRPDSGQPDLLNQG